MATILIVDDVSTNRLFLVTLLRHHGHRLVEAADGLEALAAVRTDPPDLVITDVLMPVMDGYEFVRQLRLDPANGRIPVICYTAHYGGREAQALTLATGVSYVLTKPAESAQVLSIVGRALAGELGKETISDVSASASFDPEQLGLLTDKISASASDLRAANARLRALINIGLELASERNSERLLERVCAAARDLFGATYVTLGILDRKNGRVQRSVTSGVAATDLIRTGEPVSGILGTVVAERRAIRGDNLAGVQAFLGAPIASPSHVYGCICLVGNEGRAFTEEDEHLVMALSGQVGRIYELAHEIVERQQAEHAVRHERDRAQRYLDTAEVILLALDFTGRITLVNRYGCSLLGWTSEELVGRDWIEVCLPVRIRDAARSSFRHMAAGELPIVQHPVVTRSGAERLIEWRNSMLHDGAGQVIGTISSGADITERNLAVEALSTAEERMRFALQSADVGIWDTDCATGVHRWSEAHEAHYGLLPGTFAGTFDAFVDRVHPGDRQSVLDTIATAMKSGEEFSIQNRAIWPDGTVRWLSGAGRFHLGPHGEPVRGVGISLDVTERRTLEEQYQQAQKMEAIGRLAGGVAHDFNNLLTVILGYSQLLLTAMAPEDRRRADVAQIQKAGMSAAGLTRQLLAFSRKEIIQPTLLDLNTLVAGMQEMLGRLIGEDVKVVVALGSGLALVKADRGQVEQIVMNLAVNGRDAMPDGGTLTIETANVDLDEHYAKGHLSVKPGPYVVLTMTDTGSGMTPEVQARLFEPFFTTKAPGKGTGLGLATVHGIVTGSGGTVNVYSEIGRGTSFKVYLPRADQPAVVDQAAVPVSRPRPAAETVLLVEDAEALRELATRLLQEQGYTVLVAANADEALRHFANNALIDVLLTDVVMPGASGPELAKRLIEERPALKVIYMSGYTEDAIVHRGVVNPGIAFLHKPFTAETLGRKIRDVVER